MRPSRTGLAAHPARQWRKVDCLTSSLRRDGDLLTHGSGGTFTIIQTITIITKTTVAIYIGFGTAIRLLIVHGINDEPLP